MHLELNDLIVPLFSIIAGATIGTFIRGYFANRDQRQDYFEKFKDGTIKDMATLSTRIENLTLGVIKLEGKVEQNTEIIHKHIQLMDHISRQLSRLFTLSGERSKDKKTG